MSKGERDRIFRDFQHAENPRVLVAQASAMSHGLTLTAASVIIWFAPVNSLETYEQANARIPRFGQKMNTLLAIFALALSFPAWASDLPDPVLTPGAFNLSVTQANIQQTVCVKGYTKTIRPPAHFTNKLKKRQIREYGYDDSNPKHYEEDHLIALSIGGAPDDPNNLWPEPRISEWSAKKKDRLELVLYKMVCAQEISLAEAQHAMATNWIEAWKRYVPTTEE